MVWTKPCQDGRDRVAVFNTRFEQLSGEPLSDLDGLGEGAALGHESRNV